MSWYFGPKQLSLSAVDRVKSCSHYAQSILAVNTTFQSRSMLQSSWIVLAMTIYVEV